MKPTIPQSPLEAADTGATAPFAMAAGARERPGRYLLAMLLLTAIGLAGVWRGNMSFAPEMYDPRGSREIADTLARGNGFATFDLNINIREIRDRQIARMTRPPEVVILGASHWQEAHAGLMPGTDFFNAHVHRDYWEDILGVTEMFVRHDKLPRKMIISIRDLMFTPAASRTDYLWLPIVPYYQAMTKRLGITQQPFWQTAPVQRWRELASLQMLYGNVLRWYKAPARPHATTETEFETLDVVMPDGSILWSLEHQRLFTQKRTEQLTQSFARSNSKTVPVIDPKGVAAVDAMLTFLRSKGVEVSLVHPPFNPLYWKQVADTPYRAGLARIEELTRSFAAKHGLKVFGSFDPKPLGCTMNMYIDAEHSSPACLAAVFAQFRALDADRQTTTPTPALDAVASRPVKAGERVASMMQTTAAELPRAQVRAAAAPARAEPAKPAPTAPHATPRTATAAAPRLVNAEAAPSAEPALDAARLTPRSATAAVVTASGAEISASRLLMPITLQNEPRPLAQSSRQGAR